MSKSSSQDLETEGKQIDDCPISVEAPLERKCSICDSSLEVVEKLEAPSSSSNSPEKKELPEVKTGWPILRKSFLTREKPKPKGLVIQWAMRLPARYSTSSVAHPGCKPMKSKSIGPSVPLVAVHNKEWQLPKELESLLEKYSSVSQFFSYKELVDATSNFSPGLSPE